MCLFCHVPILNATVPADGRGNWGINAQLLPHTLGIKQSPGGDWHLTPKRTGMHGHKLSFGKCVLLGTFKGETMRLIPCTIVLTLASSCPVIAQKWEIGGLGGYGWYRNSTVSNSTNSASGGVGFPSRATLGVVFA